MATDGVAMDIAAAHAGRPPPLVRRVLRRALAALPWSLLFGFAWAVVLVAILAADALLRDVFLGPRVATMLRTYAIGAGLGGAFAWTASAAVAGDRPASARFAALLVALPVFSALGVAATYFFAIYDLYAPEHADILTPLGMIQTAFTFVGGAYIVAVTGLRLLLPAALVPMLGAALLFAVVTRPRG